MSSSNSGNGVAVVDAISALMESNQKETSDKKPIKSGQKRGRVSETEGETDGVKTKRNASAKPRGLKVTFEAEKKSLQERFESEKKSLHERFEEEKKKFEAEKKSLQDGFEAEKKLLQKDFESEKKLFQKDLEIFKRDLETSNRNTAKLEKELADQRLKNETLSAKNDDYKTNLTSDTIYHMAKSHHSAMQTIHVGQQTNAQIASALGQSIIKLKDKGNRLKELMPPLPDLKLPNAQHIYHKQIAAFLTRTVTRIEEGESLLKKIDAAIADTQQTIDEERKRISPAISQQERADLQHILEEEQCRITALKYERDMLALGLENKRKSTAAIPERRTEQVATPQSAPPSVVATAKPQKK